MGINRLTMIIEVVMYNIYLEVAKMIIKYKN